MNELSIEQLTDWHELNKEKNLFGRRIVFEMIEPIIKNLSNQFIIDQLGHSFNQIPIYKITIGKGKTKVLLWSQMHGNESTGTKAIFDMFQFFENPGKNISIASQILKECTLVFIPLLNPDGAQAYTRKNAQGVDLNRDVLDLRAPESKILLTILKEFSPKFCFNLHDQRTIFSVGKQNLPATISFLAPSENAERTVTKGRKITMAVITAINKVLQDIIPNQVGRYTDEFYPTATGDNFQKAGHHTILIEAGHSKDDYNRERVRKYNFIALLTGINLIATETKLTNYEPYFDIPNNEKYYLDIIYKNIFLSDRDQIVDIGVVFKEELVSNEIIFRPIIEHIKDLSKYNGNAIIDYKGKVFDNEDKFKEIIEY